jgi:hypothetical protein
MPGKFARNTRVSVDRSQAELQNILRRYGATQIAFGWGTAQDGSEGVLIGFAINKRLIRMKIRFPSKNDVAISPAGRRRKSEALEREYIKSILQMWRALVLVVKAKLEAITIGLTTIDDEFLGFMVLPSGQTMGEWAHRELEEIYKTGKIPALMKGIESEVKNGE